MAHEIGHQFAAAHTWNNCPSSANQRSAGSAYEPGSGNTIMSYNGSCSDQNISGQVDFFHVRSLEQMSNFVLNGNGSQCGIDQSTQNEIPEVTLKYENGFYIPQSTPFALEAEASDADGDQIYYSWEQYNRNGTVTPIQMPAGNAPIFRTFEPDTFNTRFFPRLFRVLTGTSGNDEVLPTYNRDLNFRCVVRDLNPTAGGASWEEVAFHVDGNAGPFRILDLNTQRDTFYQNDLMPIQWDVANTDGELVNCQNVDILLSTDGGFTFPFTLLENTPNDGLAYAIVPAFEGEEDEVRIQVKAADNIFFDINKTDLTIMNNEASRFNVGLEIDEATICYPEFTQFNLEIVSASVNAFDEEIQLEVTGLPEGAVLTYSKNPIQAGDTSIVEVNLEGITDLGVFNISLNAIAASQENNERITEIKLLSTDFSSLGLEAPFNGASGIPFGPELQWTDVPDALLYDVELSDDPSFQTNVQRRENTTLNIFRPIESLQ
ncbi:MAG: reprolysin-like metallopeptidase, partial [Bacteroidota bacterium]